MQKPIYLGQYCLGRDIFLAIAGQPGGGPHFTVDAVKIADLGGHDINAHGKAESAGVNRTEQIFHNLLIIGLRKGNQRGRTYTFHLFRLII
jgi:hypothetical protein